MTILRYSLWNACRHITSFLYSNRLSIKNTILWNELWNYCITVVIQMISGVTLWFISPMTTTSKHFTLKFAWNLLHQLLHTNGVFNFNFILDARSSMRAGNHFFPIQTCWDFFANMTLEIGSFESLYRKCVFLGTLSILWFSDAFSLYGESLIFQWFFTELPLSLPKFLFTFHWDRHQKLCIQRLRGVKFIECCYTKKVCIFWIACPFAC